jgi:hypothetical protein
VRLAIVIAAVISSLPARVHAQVKEIDDLRHRVSVLRGELGAITAAAEMTAAMLTDQPSARLLISHQYSPSLAAEFHWHTGAGPGFGDPSDSVPGVVLAPISSWDDGAAFVLAGPVDRWESAGHAVVVFGPLAGRPAGARVAKWFVDNGATDGSNAAASANRLGNVLAMWTFYVEFVAAAARHGWHPSMYLSHMVPDADKLNENLPFRAPGAATPIPPGVSARTYLRYVDSLLTLAARPPHIALVQRAADSLRALQAQHHRLYVGACAHFLQTEVQQDPVGSPFIPFDGQYDAGAHFAQAGGSAGDGVLWFGYGSYDCPHALAQGPLHDAGARVVVVSDNLDTRPVAGTMVKVPLEWTLPEHAVPVGFDPEGIGSGSTIDAGLHYLWIRRLVAGRPE